jgi:hypothetical protein
LYRVYNDVMLPRLHFTLFIFVLTLASCTPVSSGPVPAVSGLIYLTAPAGTWQLVQQPDPASPASARPLFPLGDCVIWGLHPARRGNLIAVEQDCSNGPAVTFLRVAPAGENLLKPISRDNWKFLAWLPDGEHLYAKVDSLGEPRIVQTSLDGATSTNLPIPPSVYDLAVLPDGRIIYSQTRGLGFGSQTWLADADGDHARQILSDPQNIVAYLRPSPDGTQITYILLPDSQVPFPVGELWLADADGENTRFLAAADAGHGYAPAWSPDGSEIAFVVRENPDDPQADQSAGKLLSNVYRFEIHNEALTPVTMFTDAMVEAPVWSPDGTALFFNVARNDTIQIWFEQAGTLQPFSEIPSCCAAWLPGR